MNIPNGVKKRRMKCHFRKTKYRNDCVMFYRKSIFTKTFRKNFKKGNVKIFIPVENV